LVRDIITNLPVLEQLSLSDNSLTDQDIITILPAFQYTFLLNFLNLKSNPFGSKGLESVLRASLRMSLLHTIDLSDRILDDGIVDAFLKVYERQIPLRLETIKLTRVTLEGQTKLNMVRLAQLADDMQRRSRFFKKVWISRAQGGTGSMIGIQEYFKQIGISTSGLFYM
jgi:hypothetical protein